MQLSTKFALAIIFSICFILALSCAFIGYDDDPDYFKNILNDVAASDPGIVLLGENVDVDVDEPSLGIRWSVLGCGVGYVLDGSHGAHESNQCGLPPMYLEIFVDGDDDPTFIYNPAELPSVKQTSRRRYVQNMVQFDSDHSLDVHNDDLYPFDTYYLTGSIMIKDEHNNTLPISKLATLEEADAFSVKSEDVETYVTVNGTQVPSRDIDLWVRRPGRARFFAFLLWAANWLLTQATVAHVFFAWSATDVKPILKHLISSFAIVVAIPQLRNAMPDGPDFDGVLIDFIGFFPQMLISIFSVLAMLLLIMLRESSAHAAAAAMAPQIPPVSRPMSRPVSGVTAEMRARRRSHSRGVSLSKEEEYSEPVFSVTESILSPVNEGATSPPRSPLRPLILGLGRKKRTDSVELERGEGMPLIPKLNPPPPGRGPRGQREDHLNDHYIFPPPATPGPATAPLFATGMQHQQQHLRNRSTKMEFSAASAPGWGGRPGSVYGYELGKSGGSKGSILKKTTDRWF
ncbi:hypothetical protein CONPUDRAFT_153971 [Coniophora puteana RWD-64-598 SS2]|uniref:Uncharacterized protein n=1 Tax=Coniophora puteana (strain RWD-64-598) TaxID=741705 RepID=A0A5M3MRP7_CONPW|nr:uncharacterized protein CONPUDRAFT_153971 [Coniophora puteana RWD-64-598 SS2]EIW81424.1 hypothetical protein CONPUDRAFT_153971 [Coniophora puteana RWD-64-598 SS2]